MFKDHRFSIRSKISLGYFLVIVCLGIALVLVSSRISSLQKELDFIVAHDLQVHELASQIETSLLNMESGQRGYVITHDEEYLEPYYNGKKDFDNVYAELSDLLADNPEQQQNLKDLYIDIEKWIDNAGTPVISFVQNGQTDNIERFFLNDSGKQAMGDIRDKLSFFQDTEYELTTQRTDEIAENNNLLKILMYIFWLIVSLFTVLASLIVSRSITKTLKQVTESIQEIGSANSDLSGRIPVKSRDEVGMLASSTNQLLDNIQLQNGIKSHIGDLVGLTQKTTDVKTLAEQLIQRVSLLINAQYGALYLHTSLIEREQFMHVASYAWEGRQTWKSSFVPGEGLLGQCAVNREMLILDNIPDQYINIGSGIGRSMPKQILIVPILFEDRTLAVLEFAALQPFQVSDKQFLEELMVTFGPSIQSFSSRVEIEQLYSESQAMTEELQVQTEELRNQTEELKIINEDLEHQKFLAEVKSREVEQAKEELEHYAEQLKLSSQYKSEFLANMSHELRTPLNSILILSEFLNDNENNTLSAEEQEYTKVILDSGKDLLTLINDILDLSKVEAGKMDIKNDYVNITALPEKMEHFFRPIADKKGLVFSIKVHRNVPDLFYSDDKRIEQILKNLLSNAFKFTESGEVKLEIRMADQAETSQYGSMTDRIPILAFSVIDTGIGIHIDKKEVIFESFQQADGATFRKYGGTGLGLSISRELAELLGGWITLSSEENVGSTFTLYLPSMEQEFSENLTLAESEAATAELDADYPKQLTPLQEVFSGKTVLIVDDDDRNVFSLSRILEKQGMIIRQASNGAESLEKLANDDQIDIVLMDIMMPEMDGYQTIQAIRKQKKFEVLPIIAITARAMNNEREKCLTVGANDYISKPIQLDQLLSVIRVWLSEDLV